LRCRVPGSQNFPGRDAGNQVWTNRLGGANDSLSFKVSLSRLTTSVFSTTKKCPLACRHCFEWDRLGKSESLSSDQLKRILWKIQDYGISNLQIGGGEPMARFDDLTDLIRNAARGTDLWLLTSGYNLTIENACKLKKAGLTGVRISLDHWEKDRYNEFRGSPKAFDWATTAAVNSRKAGLAMGLALCVLNDFLSENFLFKYLAFAKSLGAAFIMILEPRETGHFSNSDVRLPEVSMKLLDNFFLTVNSSPLYKKYPSVIFPGYHQRRIGCFGAGIRYLYIDSEGSAHACPFCQDKMGDCIEEELSEIIPRIRQKGCFIYSTPEMARTLAP